MSVGRGYSSFSVGGGEEGSKSITWGEGQSKQGGGASVHSEQGTVRRSLGDCDHVPGSDKSSMTDTPFSRGF